MNNKGFAIISLVYGLVMVASVILFLTLRIMDNTNSQNDILSDDIEEQLIYCSETYNPTYGWCDLGN